MTASLMNVIRINMADVKVFEKVLSKFDSKKKKSITYESYGPLL